MKEDNRKKTGSITIEFEITDVLNDFLFHLDKMTNSVGIIHEAVGLFQQPYSLPLPTENLPIQIRHNEPAISIDEQKNDAVKWLINKTIEDIISGLFKSLKKSYKYLRLYSLAQENNKKRTEEELQFELVKIEKEVEDIHFPQFISYIKKNITEPIPYLDEIISFNHFRNCLVHRNGVVGMKDLKDKENKSLNLKWIELKSLITKNGKKSELTYNHRKKPTVVQNIEHFRHSKMKSYFIGESISIDINEFNGIAYTCTEFTKGLLNLLPRPTKKTTNANK